MMRRPATLMSAMIVVTSLLAAPSVDAARGDGASRWRGQASGEVRREARRKVVRPARRSAERRRRGDGVRAWRVQSNATPGSGSRKSKKSRGGNGGESASRTDSGDVRISRHQAATIARGSAGGRVLSIGLQGGSRPVYRVKVLTRSGRVRTVTVDGRTGAVR